MTPTYASFDRFYQAEFSRMVSLACTICGDYQQGEDVAQEALARAHKNWDALAHYESPGGWLRRVTINLSLSRIRRVKRELSALGRIARERSTHTPADHSGDPASLGFDHEVWDAVRRLPPRQRAVVGLFYQEDMATADIAEVLGCSVSTATSHLNQARRRLGDDLGNTERDEAPPTNKTRGARR